MLPLVAAFWMLLSLVVADVPVFMLGRAVEGGGDAVGLLVLEILEDSLLVEWGGCCCCGCACWLFLLAGASVWVFFCVNMGIVASIVHSSLKPLNFSRSSDGSAKPLMSTCIRLMSFLIANKKHAAVDQFHISANAGHSRGWSWALSYHRRCHRSYVFLFFPVDSPLVLETSFHPLPLHTAHTPLELRPREG